MMNKEIANWGNYPAITSDERTISWKEDIAAGMHSAAHYIARGNGRCYGDASLAAVTLNTTSLKKIITFDPVRGIFECESGLTLDKILEVTVPKGWFLPVTPGTKFITTGGAVASDVHGKNHHVDGSFSRHVIEMDILTANDEIITCTPEQHPDLFWATCGGMGLTGVIIRIKFSLKKIETSYIRQKQIKAANLDEIIRLFDENKHYTYSVAWIDCLKKGKGFGRSILILGEHAVPDDLDDKKKKEPLKLPGKKQITFPFTLPSFVLNSFTIKLFNFFYYHKNLKKIQDSVVSYEPFFYPLDAVLHWNRGYGKKGFVQYQFVLPMESKQGLIEILERISAKGMGSFLAVLKVFGEQDDMISFPMKGYTLALDFPIRKGLFEFLDELDQVVLKYGGRLYLSKDARMKPEIFQKSYPYLSRFLNTVSRYNPGFRFRSDQSDRLKITS
jgi:FAD/FMN-containing dehydrogenase